MRQKSTPNWQGVSGFRTIHRMRIIILILVSAALCGCASVIRSWTAETPEVLLASDIQSQPFCAAGELAQVQERVRGYLERCHQSRTLIGQVAVPGMLLFPKYQQNWKVERRPTAGGGEEYFVWFDYGYVLGSRVEPARECGASVTSYAKVSGWSNRFALVNAAARGETPECLAH